MFRDLQDATFVEKENEIAQLKLHKKVLIKEVKSLRSDITVMQAERDEAFAELQLLREQARKLMELAR
jgi:cell division protein FtsB